MKKSKKIVQILILLMVVGILSGCSKKKAEVPDSDDWHDGQLIVHGVQLKDVGNMTIDDIVNLGFQKAFVPEDLEPNKTAYVSLSATDGSKGLYDFKVVNKTGKTAAAGKCSIKSIVVTTRDNEDEKVFGAKDIYLANGVGLGMTSDEVRKIMGEPDEEKINDEKADFYKMWKYHFNSNEDGIVLFFEKGTDVMTTLTVTY